ncbi:MAG: tRNA lysidine(34) synthetase TilS [Bacillota bacterium]
MRETILRHSMIEKGQTVLAAVSGGPDSVALLNILVRLRGPIGFELAACHLDHGFRGEESEADARFVAGLCSDAGVPCRVLRMDVPGLMSQWGIGAEEAGRRARYRFYEETAFGLGVARVALGHTLDDQAETVLMRLIRGSGLEGLGGIPPVRGMYIRPLLFVSRREIEQYCAAAGLSWRTDRTNQAPVYFRNQIRLQAIPALERWNPRLKDTLAGTADRLREDAAYLELAGREAAAGLASGKDGGMSLARDRFNDLHPAVRRQVVRAIAREITGESGDTEHMPLGYCHVEAIISLSGRGGGEGVLHLPGGLLARVGKDELWLGKAAGESGHPIPVASPVVLRVPGITYIEGMGVRIRAEVTPAAAIGEEPFKNTDPLKAYVDYSLVEHPLRVRSRMDGDYFYPLGLGGRKKVGDFMTSLKLPAGDRHLVPVVLSGEQVVWVGGYRLDERFKVTPATTEVLLLTMEIDRN